METPSGFHFAIDLSAVPVGVDLSAVSVGVDLSALPMQYGGFAGGEIGRFPKLVAIALLAVVALVVVALLGWLAYRSRIERDRLEEARERAPDQTEL